MGPCSVPKETILSLLRCRRCPDGKWTCFLKDPGRIDVRSHSDEDKCPETIRIKPVTNKFCNILHEEYGGTILSTIPGSWPRRMRGKSFVKGPLCALSLFLLIVMSFDGMQTQFLTLALTKWQCQRDSGGHLYRVAFLPHLFPLLLFLGFCIVLRLLEC